ncbi:nicotinate-nucleotide--dimethylbenzimidazole phosphoribosyltransferase [Aquimarina intermedia]|uniref:Nicotinate-nucleotide--dimethylbenzimidazole phosphoribosyltransferase n=1 Tax=Aquimarina intermedia TaxID=350814 RepID=A0A5S5BZC9_9FLAO|nr:nicotinate-nucleotide--dimethylbenzimidazole phosphoribosyltransferase [Aquimarina intermedia]TYP71708.1 nicotinate-nucleotide-dimethylbenzimidazole phosphoribosyltransferase [Aquimarina intermedia]
MMFSIKTIHTKELSKKLRNKIDGKTKPISALGMLESLAYRIGMIQQTDQPTLKKPTILVFAGDHGIAKENQVNPYPQEVTSQMVLNFLNGGAAINVFCKQHDIALQIVDAGVNYKFEKHPDLIHAKINYGTQNYQYAPAMTIIECKKAIQKGAEIVTKIYNDGCNVVGFGEMGIGNTSSATLLMAYITKLPIAECVGAGTGLSKDRITQKQNILTEVFKKHTPQSFIDALATFGGFEIAMITGAILKAAELKMTILIDGFIVTSALLIAHAIHKDVVDYCVFAHTSGEQGHSKMLAFLDQKPLLSLQLRLGEGTGSAVAYPLLVSAVNFLNAMASFEEASITSVQ